MYSPIHRQANTPMINIQSTRRTAIDFVIMFHSQCYLVGTVIHIACKQSNMFVCVYVCVCVCIYIYICVCVCNIYIYIYIYHNIETLAGQRIKNGTAVNSACQGNHSACHFGHSCHRFVSPALGEIIAQAAAYSGKSASSCMYGEAAVSILPVPRAVVYDCGTLISVWLLLSWL